MSSLTTGCIEVLFADNRESPLFQHPVVQVLNIRKIPLPKESSSSERVRYVSHRLHECEILNVKVRFRMKRQGGSAR
ncbi:hypothetical protein BC938DRAFT_484087 [Jimgerdemannia flammicorona]|uniref:Uncharacterized protein n=1 Tax=Jimgerdemannia flammicorona TaxID=994334 RepID=A0A433QAK1_9FUNG|nr:hypothetical protein BC938DRAFT_484087 [Jimgerdemannia flammicorona]